MKKHICIILLAALLLLCACQPTPENPIVVGKDQTEMLNKAKETLAPEKLEQSLRERLNVPDRYTYSYHKGDLTIDADAEIVVPDGELPIVRVFPKTFDQQEVTALWNVLIGDTPMVAKQNADTKDDIAARIRELTEAIETDDLNRLHFTSSEEAEQAIEALKRMYLEAPETANGDPADGTLLRGVMLDDNGKEVASHTYLSAVSEKTGYCFSVSNSWNNKETIFGTAYDKYGRAVGTTFRQVNSSSDFAFYKQNEPETVCYVWGRELTLSEPCPKEFNGSITATPGEAKAFAEDFLLDSGLDASYHVQRIFLICDYEASMYSYRVVCTHSVNGCETLMPANLVDVDHDDEYAPLWEQERFTMDVNDNGVYYIHLNAPIAIGDTITETSNLLPFREIQGIMKKMIPIIYADYDNELNYDMQINRVELGLWRIRVQDKIDQGMLVPTWAFYANTTEWDPSMPEIGKMESYKPILLINAVDGSIIDPIKGY